MHSFWENDSYFAPVDIIIIGGGLMGLWTALELKKTAPSLSITILERHSIPTGASTRNAGFACFGSLTELLADESDMGTEAMLELVEQRFKGIEKIKSCLSPTCIDYDACGGYEAILNSYTAAPNLVDHIQRFNRLLQPITGIPTSFSLTTQPLHTWGLSNFDSLICNPLEAGIHSGKLVTELTKMAVQNGIRFLFGVEVTKLEDDSIVTIHTKLNGLLKAKHIIGCTNGFTQALFPTLNVVPARGQIVLTKPIDGLLTKGCFHFNEGFYYWRNIGNRILLGGARNTDILAEQTTNLNGSDEIRNALAHFLQNHFITNNPIEIEQSWSGIMGFTKNKKPLCEQISEHITAAIACNGIGVALTPILAETVAKNLLQTI